MVETIRDDGVGLLADFDNRARRAAVKAQRRSTQTIPVIDFAAYRDGAGLAARQDVARALRATCLKTGFFYLVNHGIAQAEFDAAHAMGPQVLPVAARREGEARQEHPSHAPGLDAGGRHEP